MAETIGSIQVVASINTKDYDSGKKNIEKGNADLENGAAKTSKSFSSAWTGAIAGVAAAMTNKFLGSVTSSIDGAVKRVDTLNNAPKVLQNLGFSAGESADAIKNLDKGVKGLPTSLDSAASALTSIAAASGLGVKDATRLTLAFNNMALAGGKGAAEADRALTQFTQALGRGKFQIQDFNTLAEVMPAQLNQVAKSLLGPGANVRQLGTALSDGTISIGQFNEKIIDLSENGASGITSFADQAKDSTNGIGTGFANLQTAITRGVGSIIQTIGSGNIANAISFIGTAFTVALTGVAGFINFVKANSTIFSVLAVSVATAGGAILLYSAYTRAAAVSTAAFAAVSSYLTLVNSLQAQGLVILKASWLALNTVMKANPIGIIITLVAALVAGLIFFFTQTETGQKIMQGFFGFMSDAFRNIVGWASSAWASVTNSFSQAWNNIRSIFGGVGSFFSGVFSTIIGVFGNVGTAVGNAIGGAFRGVINGILRGAVNIINGFINAINGAIDVVNDIPGVSVGKLSTLGVPALASGGITTGPTLAMIGEGSEQEAVIPLSKLDAMLNNSGSDDSKREYSIGVVNIANEVDGERWLRRLTNDQEIVSNGLVPQQKYMGA